MAKAIARFVKQPKPIEYVELQDGVELTLTAKEAQTLADILDFIGGSSTLSRRKYADAIKVALESAGYSAPWDPKRHPPGVKDIDRTRPQHTGLYFADAPERV